MSVSSVPIGCEHSLGRRPPDPIEQLPPERDYACGDRMGGEDHTVADRPGPLVITRRGIRLVHTIAVTILALLILGVTGIATGNGSSEAEWLSLRGAQALDAAPCPPSSSIPVAPTSTGRLAEARDGRFRVFGPRPTLLRVPIDWTIDPLGSHRYRQNLQKLRFTGPLVTSYATTGNTDDLQRALAVGLDWVRHNPRGESETLPEAWSDKVVGDRVPYLGYLVRAGACEGLLSPSDRRLLLRSIDEHGTALASKEFFVPDNHGLFVQIGLLRLVDMFPFIDQADRWRALARKRFEATLRGRLSEGVWLEHSSAYQLLAIRAVEDFLGAYGTDDELSGLLEEMRASAGWFVKPNGELTQFGDSDLGPVPAWALEEEQDGLKAFFGAGFAFVRAAGETGDTGYLAVTDGFHNVTHKHADELSFELFDHGTTVVDDTGLYDKDPGPIRDFVVSDRAHSVLTVDGQDFPIDDPEFAYGSGLLAAGEGDGWYGIEGENPLLEPQGVRHRRLFLYRPGTALIIVDEVRSDALHTYTRYLQFHPHVDVRAGGPQGSLDLVAAALSCRAHDLRIATPTLRSKVRGQEEPLQGWTSPRFRAFRPRWTVAYSDQATTETHAISLSLDETDLHASGVRTSGARAVVELIDASGAGSAIEVVRQGRTLSIRSGPS